MILVTGGTGMVGGHLLLKLVQANKEVTAIKRASSNLEQVKKLFSLYEVDAKNVFNNINWINADITNLPAMMELCSGIDEVYHCAAFISFHPSDRRKMFDNNIIGTANLVDACLASDVRKMCHVSSVAALGEPIDNELITEKTLWKSAKGRSAYAFSKFKSEMEVWRGTCEGLNAIVVNPSVILGPGNWQSGSASIIHNIYKGLKFYPPGKTGFVDIRDVIEAMVLLMKSDMSGERFILNADNMYYKDVFEKIAVRLHASAPKIRVNPFIAGLAWRAVTVISAFTGNKPAITKETVQAGFNDKSYSNQKIIDLTGFRFRNIDDTIEFTVKSYLSSIK